MDLLALSSPIKFMIFDAVLLAAVTLDSTARSGLLLRTGTSVVAIPTIADERTV
jgi:hypothetical protein